MKKLTLIVGALLIAGASFACGGDKGKACCKKGSEAKKECCKKGEKKDCHKSAEAKKETSEKKTS